MKHFKSIFPFFMFVIITCLSCSKEEKQVITNGDEREIEMKLSLSDIIARAPSGTDEDKVNELDILVFNGAGDDAKFLYKRYAWKAGSSYKSTLKMGEKLTLYFVANSRTLLEDLNDMEGKTWKEVKEKLIMKSPNSLINPEALPMWGFMHNVDVKDLVINNLGKIGLVRSVASVDFSYIPTGENNFTLSTGYICYAPTTGYLPFSESNLNSTNEITAPESPNGMTTTNTLTYAVPSGSTAITNIFYLYDNDAALPSSTKEHRQSKLIISGTWNSDKGSGKITYYPIALRDKDNIRLQVTRNTKYVITVSAVNGDGYPSIEEAMEAEDINMDYDIIPWIYENDREIFIEGPFYLSMASRLAQLTYLAGATTELEFHSNAPTSMIKMRFAKDTSGDFVKPPVKNKDFKVDVKEKEGKTYFVITALRYYQENTGYLEDKVTVKFHRAQFDITMQQMRSGWGGGGDVPVTP